MKDANKTKTQLVSELVELRQRVSALAASETALKRSEEGLAKVSECFLSFGTDAFENINRMTALCGELLGATCALYNRLYQGLFYSWGQWNTPPDFNPVDKPEGHICYDVIRTAGDKVLVVTNLPDTHYAETDPNVIPYKLQTYVGRAVKLGDDYLGSLCVVFQDDFRPSEMDEKFMEIIASAIGVEEKRKQAEEELQQKITELNSFLNNIPDMAWLKDMESRFIAVNQAFGDAVEMDPESLLNQTCEVCFGEEEGKKFQEDDRKVIESRKQQVLEEQIADSRGKEVWLETIKSPILDKSGTVRGTVGIAREITKRKQAEEALRDNEERYRALSNATFEAIFISENGICIDTNQTATEMFGYDYDELIGIFGTDVIAPESKQLVKHNMLSGYEEPYEAIAQRKDGTTFHVEIRGKMTEYKGRSVRVTIVHDIDKSKKMEERLRESEKKYREIFELSPEAIVLLDSKGNILDVNERSQDWLGYSPEEIVGKSSLELPFLSEEGKSKAMAKLSQRLAGKKVSAYELGFYTKSGEKRVGRIVANSIQDENGKVIQVLVMISDITERKQAEQALRESEAELKVRSRDLEEVNAALKVLLKRREEDKIELAESVQINVKQLVLPYLEKLKKSDLEPQQMTLIGILESHCKDVVSPFVNKLSSKFLKLTPTEIKLADLIKSGRTTKEAADLLGLSENTVQVHRHHIRSKLGLKHAKINLRSYLRSLD